MSFEDGFKQFRAEHSGALRRRLREVNGERIKVNERVNDPIQVGRKVKVKRSSGAIEDGWEVKGFGEGGDTVFVGKDEGEGGLRKEVSIEELEYLNPPTEGPKFAEPPRSSEPERDDS